MVRDKGVSQNPLKSGKGGTAMANRGTASQVTGGYVEFQAAVLRALPRDIDPDVALGWAQNGESLARVLKDVLTPNGKPAGNTYPLSVNYDLPVEGAVKLGQYDWANGDITGKNFPTTRTGKAEVVVELIHFNRVISTKDAQRELDQRGYRPAELHELLAFGEKYPELQRQFPIVAPGSVWQYRVGDRRVPYLRRHGSRRSLNLSWIGHDWHELCRFAAVRK
ncbi:MAG: hypothetical protein Q8N61_02345 [bacterium]|nr:hypothetical protein [bacterium]